EPHAQCHRSHAGLGRRAYGPVAAPGFSTAVVSQRHRCGTAYGESGSDLFCVLYHQAAGQWDGVGHQPFHCGVAWGPFLGHPQRWTRYPLSFHLAEPGIRDIAVASLRNFGPNCSLPNQFEQFPLIATEAGGGVSSFSIARSIVRFISDTTVGTSRWPT